jgi:hypothetical protein
MIIDQPHDGVAYVRGNMSGAREVIDTAMILPNTANTVNTLNSP